MKGDPCLNLTRCGGTVESKTGAYCPACLKALRHPVNLGKNPTTMYRKRGE